MFYYLGRKKRLAGCYPDPQHDLIIEPFAGSAAYSLHGERWKCEVLLCDLSPTVSIVWRYLLEATVSDILALPELEPGERLSDHAYLSEAERWLISFHINPGANQRSDVVTKFSRWPAGRRYIAANLHKVRHWQFVEDDYRTLANQPATWFIDPPYERVGHYYMTNTVSGDFASLAGWCQSRLGQTIVCEQQGASWLPFMPLASIAIAGHGVSREAVWLQS